MTVLTVDAAIRGKLLKLKDEAELRDEAGRLLGYFRPAGKKPKSNYDGYYIPEFTEEQLREWENQPGGRPLKEILADLEKRVKEA